MTAVDGIRGVVEGAIQRAAQATGVDFSFLMKTAHRESGLNPNAKSGSSSAAGLFQFVGQTWLSTLKAHGAKHGYARYADLIEKGSDGQFHVNGSEAHRAVMDLRMDPHAASMMAGELTSDSAAYLKGRTGRSPTAGELYAAHFLGPQGSAKLIEAAERQPGATAAHLFPDAAHANKAIFYPGGQAATVGQVYANLTRDRGLGPADRRARPRGLARRRLPAVRLRPQRRPPGPATAADLADPAGHARQRLHGGRRPAHGLSLHHRDAEGPVGKPEELGGASYLPRDAAGGGPSAERSEEPRVEGASLRRGGSVLHQCSAIIACPLHHALFGARSPSRRFTGEVEVRPRPPP